MLELQELSHRAEISDIINQMAWCQDQRDWAGLDEVLAECVDVDYGPAFGGRVEGVARADLIANWRSSAEQMDASQHVLTGMQIRVNGTSADVRANEIVWLIRSAVEGSPLYNFGTVMHLRLACLPEGWRISTLSVRETWSDGNAEVLGGYTLAER